MDVWEFEKCLATHLDECANVLQCTGQPVPASQVRAEWAYHIELQIEPAGWKSLWTIPRLWCEEYGIRYPTIVCGTVKQVLFKELKAIFTVDFVQDDDVHLPETYTVDLEDLWPTIHQDNLALDAEGTASCLDSLRFFYKNIWMPWDADMDDDLDWPARYLESRIKFYHDMKKEIKRPIVNHIKRLISEAKYLQQRKEYLEMELSDDEELNDTRTKNEMTKLMKLHMRMTMIKCEMELLENPETRVAFEYMDKSQLKQQSTCHQPLRDNGFNSKKIASNNSSLLDCVFIVSTFFLLDEQIEFLQRIRRQIDDGKKPIQLCMNLQTCLELCESTNVIYISHGEHTINFLEYLHENGRICGVNSTNSNDQFDNINNKESIIKSADENGALLKFDTNFVIENCTLDCRNVRTGIPIRKGVVQLINCKIIGDFKSGTSVGLLAMSGATLSLENCQIIGFTTGVYCHQGGTVQMRNSTIENCYVAMEVMDSSRIVFLETNNRIVGGKQYGICMTSRKCNEKKLVLENITDLKCEHSIMGTCTFSNNGKSNIVVYNRSKTILNESILAPMAADNCLFDVISDDDEDDCYAECNGRCGKDYTGDDLSNSSVYDDSVMHITIDDSIMENSVVTVE